MFRHGGGQLVFNNILQTGVDGEDDIQAILGFDILVPISHQFTAAPIHFRAAPTANATELGLHGQLNPVLADHFPAVTHPHISPGRAPREFDWDKPGVDPPP